MKRPAAAAGVLPPPKPTLRYSNVQAVWRIGRPCNGEARAPRWVYMAYCGRKYLGSFASELEAARAALQAKPAGTTLKLLLLDAGTPSAGSTPSVPSAGSTPSEKSATKKSRFRGVAYHVRTSRWVAAHKRGGFLGSFGTEKEAAKRREEVVGKLVQRPSSARVDLGDQARRVRAMAAVFQGTVPGDLQAALEERVRCPALAHNAPFLYQVSLRGKEGPWKEALREAFLAAGAPSLMALGSDVEAEAAGAARQAHAILAMACRSMVGVDRQAWVANTGRGTSFHMGWLPMMAEDAYGVLRGATPADRRAQRLPLGFVGKEYAVLAFDPAVHTEKFRQARRVAELLHAEGVPRTLSEWGATLERVEVAVRARGLSVPGCATLRRPRGRPRKSSPSPASTKSTPSTRTDWGYHWPWYLRTFLVVEMRAAGVAALAIDADMSAEAMAAMFPDQGQWLSAFGRDGASLTAIMKRVGYTGPPELLSMVLCLFGDAAVTARTPESLEGRVPELRGARADYARAHGIQPHPAVLLEFAAQRKSS